MSSSTLADFEFLGRLGKGSFGEVHKVRRSVDGGIYVCKLIHMEELSPEEQRKSIDEVTIMAALDSPFVVRYYDSFIDDGHLCIIMELADRGDLARMIRKQAGAPIPESRIWIIFLQITLGVAYLHWRRTLHRDLKSANVFLCSGDRVKIGDLGVARVLGTESFFARTCVGTPYYLSPGLCALARPRSELRNIGVLVPLHMRAELIEGQPYNDKSDMWALGCILYELCTGRHAFDAKNQGTLIMKIIQGTYPPIPEHYSDLLAALVDALLTRDSNTRPSAMDILMEPDVYAKLVEYDLDIPVFVKDAWRAAHPEDASAPHPAAVPETPLPADEADEAALHVYDKHMGGSITPRTEVRPTFETEPTAPPSQHQSAPAGPAVRISDTIRILPAVRPPSVADAALHSSRDTHRPGTAGISAPSVAQQGAGAQSHSAPVTNAAPTQVPKGYMRGTRFRKGDPTAGVRRKLHLPLSAEAASAAAAADQRRRAQTAATGASRAPKVSEPTRAPSVQSHAVTHTRLPAAAAPMLDSAPPVRRAASAESRAMASEVAALPVVTPVSRGTTMGAGGFVQDAGVLSPPGKSLSVGSTSTATPATGISSTPSCGSGSMAGVASVRPASTARGGFRPSLDLLKTVSAAASAQQLTSVGGVASAESALPAEQPAAGGDEDDAYAPDFHADTPVAAPCVTFPAASTEAGTVSTSSFISASPASAAHAPRHPAPTLAWASGDAPRAASREHADEDVAEVEDDIMTDMDLRRIADGLREQRAMLTEHIATLKSRCESLVPADMIDAVFAADAPMSVMDVSELSPDAYMALYRLEYAVGRLRDVDAQLLPFTSSEAAAPTK